jgi:hypothetical protein
MVLAYLSGHFTLKSVGDVFGVSYATVARAVSKYKKSVICEVWTPLQIAAIIIFEELFAIPLDLKLDFFRTVFALVLDTKLRTGGDIDTFAGNLNLESLVVLNTVCEPP